MRPISSILIGVIYHPPQATADDNNNLYNHVQGVVDSYLSGHPDSLVCICGDFNPNSTNLSPTIFRSVCGLTQIIKVLTRETGTLDWCLTNFPKTFSAPIQLPKLGSSDHYSVIIKCCIPCKRPSKRVVITRDTRVSAITAFGRWITALRWDPMFAMATCEEKWEYFYRTLTDAIERHLPPKARRVYETDKPWLSPEIKSMIAKRQKSLSIFGL